LGQQGACQADRLRERGLVPAALRPPRRRMGFL